MNIRTIEAKNNKRKKREFVHMLEFLQPTEVNLIR